MPIAPATEQNLLNSSEVAIELRACAMNPNKVTILADHEALAYEAAPPG